jgi:hypothetical protein
MANAGHRSQFDPTPRKVQAMPEATSNVEFAHRIQEHGHHPPSPADRRAQWVEMVEALVLAIVAVATAWSGYQASKWDALSA